MAKSIYNNANVVYQYDTFAGWLTKTNMLIYDMGTTVLTVNGSAAPDVTTGNAFVNGHFGANTLYVTNVLQGGTANTPGTLSIISNTNINNTFSVGSTSNVTITSTTVRFSNSSSINATSYTGTAANATLFAGVTLGTVNSAITANGDAAYSNALATVATIYQTMAGLSANVALLTANAAGFLSNSSGTLSNIQSWISGNSATAYTNAIAVANSSAATAYANAIAIANTRAATAYSNAIAFANAAVTNGTWTAANSLYANNAGGVGGIAVNTASPLDGFVLAYDSGSSKIIFKNPSNITVSLNANTVTANVQLQAGSNGSAYVANIYSNATVSAATFRANTISLTVDSGSIALNSPTTVNGSLTVGTTSVNSTAINIGNSTVFTTVNSTAFSGTANNATYLNGTTLSTIQSQITGNAATAYTNAVAVAASDATSKAGTAYTNAVAVAASDATSKAATAYTNAVANAAWAAGVAYTNAIAVAANATNLTSGTVNPARLASGTANSTTYLAGNGTWTSIGLIATNTAAAYTWSNVHTFNANVNITGNTTSVLTIGTVSVNSTIINVGNSTVFTTVNSTAFSGTANNATYLGGATLATIQSQITGNAATAYTNAVAVAASDATTKAGTAYSNAVAVANQLASNAYSNAVSVANQLASNAYSNAIAIAANATNLTSGTVAPARLGSGTANSTTVLYGNSTWAPIVSGATLVANTTDTQTFYIPMSNSTTGAWTNGVIATSMTYVPDSSTLTVGTIVESSSIKVKENVVNLTYSTSDILSLRPVRYNKINSSVEEIGLIAEEVYKIIPEVVKMDHNNEPEAINYGRLVSVLISAIQDLDARVKELENR